METSGGVPRCRSGAAVPITSPTGEDQRAPASRTRGGRRIDALVIAVRWGDRRAAYRLGESGDPRAVEPLIAALGGGINGAVAAALGKLGDIRAVEPLIAVLADRNHRDCPLVADALGRLGDARAVGPLVAALEQGPRPLRESAAKALDALGWRPTDDRHRALKAVADRDWGAAIKVGPEAVVPLTEVVQDGDHVKQAAEALGEIGDRRAVPALTQRLAGDTDGTTPISCPRSPSSTLGACRSGGSRPSRRCVTTTGVLEDRAVGELRRIRSSWDGRTVDSLITLLGAGRPIAAAAAARALEGDVPRPRSSTRWPPTRRSSGVQLTELGGTSADRLIAELVVIGRDPGYLRHRGDLTGFEERDTTSGPSRSGRSSTGAGASTSCAGLTSR